MRRECSGGRQAEIKEILKERNGYIITIIGLTEIRLKYAGGRGRWEKGTYIDANMDLD